MTEAEFLWTLLAVLGAVAGLGVAVKKIFFSGLPQPLETRRAASYALREDLDRHGKRLEGLESRVSDVESRIYQRIDRLDEKVSRQHAETMRALGRLEGGQ